MSHAAVRSVRLEIKIALIFKGRIWSRFGVRTQSLLPRPSVSHLRVFNNSINGFGALACAAQFSRALDPGVTFSGAGGHGRLLSAAGDARFVSAAGTLFVSP